jgi:tetratricopeptide (TPR) repeat protein
MSVQKAAVRFLLLPVIILLLSSFVDVKTQGFGQKRLHQNSAQNDRTIRESNLAGAYYHLGVGNLHEPSNSDRAIEQLERAVELDDVNAEYHYMLAEAYMANYQSAGIFRMPLIAPKVKEQLELAVKLGPDSARYREALMQFYVFAPGIFGGSFQKAHDQAAAISKLDPYLGMLAHASVYAEEGETGKALTLYRKAISSRPAAWQAYHHFGLYYLGIYEVDRAIAMFKKYSEIAPDQADSYNQLGKAYQLKRMYVEAIAAFQKALEKDPSLTPLVFRIAQLYEFKGNIDLAREQYQRYLSMVPSGRAADDARIKIRELAR